MLSKKTKTKACSYVEAQKSWVTKIMCFQWKWMFWFFCRTAQSSWTAKVDSHCYSMEKYFFFSFDRIFLIIYQFERYPYMLSQLFQRLHVLKLRKYIHLLWMANTYIYVRTHVFMHAWQHSEWFVKLIRHWLQAREE